MENNNLEFREGQSEMACEIVDAISQKKNLVVEAGVGIGKSFAYLVPLIYYNYYLQKTSGNSYFNYNFAGTITRRYTLYHGEITNISRSFIG